MTTPGGRFGRSRRMEEIAREMADTRRELAKAFARVGERPSAANMASWNTLSGGEQRKLARLYDEWASDPAGFATAWRPPPTSGARPSSVARARRGFVPAVERPYRIAADSGAAGLDRIAAVQTLARLAHDDAQPASVGLDAAEALRRLAELPQDPPRGAP